MNEREVDNDTLTLINAIRKLFNEDRWRFHLALNTADFHERAYLIESMTPEGKQIIALAFERIDSAKQPEVLSQPIVYAN